MKARLLLSIGLAICLLMAFCLPMCAPAPPVEEEAPPVEEEELARYINAFLCSSPVSNLKVADYIEDNLGVSVRHSHVSCGELRARLEAEAPNFSADIAHTCGPEADRSKRDGWSIAYDSPTWRGAGAIWVDADNFWFNTGNIGFILVGNTDRLAEMGETIPDSWDGLLDPKWKDEILMPSPLTSGTAYRMMYSFLTLYGFNTGKGEDGLWEFYEKLDKNMHHYTRSGSAPLNLVCQGEFTLGIANWQYVLLRIEEGYHITWSVPKEGVGYDSYPALILKGTKKEYTCQKVIDLMGTRGFAEMWTEATSSMTKEGIAPPLFPEPPKFIPNIDLAWAYENKDRLCDEWKERFLRPE